MKPLRVSALFITLLIAGCGKQSPGPPSREEWPRLSNQERANTTRQAASKRTVTPILLDGVIGFSDGSSCEPYPATEELLSNLLVNTSNPRELALGNLVLPERFRPAFGEARLTKEMEGDLTNYDVTVPVSGLWHGLKITEISSSGMPESDAGAWTYTFNEPFERVRDVLNSMGFGFDNKGNQPRDPLEDHIWASLFVDKGSTILSCEPRGTPPSIEESNRRAKAIRQKDVHVSAK